MDSRDKINDYYENLQEKNKEKQSACASRIKLMHDELESLKAENSELERLFFQYLKKKNKKHYKYGRLYKESNFQIKLKQQTLINELKKIQKLESYALKLNQMRIDNYKSRLDLLKTLENFTYFKTIKF